MTYVVDASVAVKWFVLEDFHGHALSLLENHTGDLEAPDFLVVEVTNVARTKFAKKEIAEKQARNIPSEIREYIGDFHPSAGLADRALDIAIALNHSVYDCLYLACAEAVGGVTLTVDERLCKVVEGTPYAPLVQHLKDEILPPLRIPLSKVEQIIHFVELAKQTRQTVNDAYSEGNRLHITTAEERQLYANSPGILRLKSFLDELPRHERVDLHVLGWLAKGTAGDDLQAIFQHAEKMTHENEDNQYLAGLTYYLREGLELLKKQGTGDPPE